MQVSAKFRKDAHFGKMHTDAQNFGKMHIQKIKLRLSFVDN